jgi:hypothetical protein
MLVAVGILSACSADTQQAVARRARDDMMRARAAYTHCLQENAAEPGKCDSYKQAFEANLQAYRATKAAVEPR